MKELSAIAVSYFMKKKLLIAVAFIPAIVIPMVLFARTLDVEFRQCMQAAVGRQQSELLRAQTDFHIEIEGAMQERMQSYIASWNHDDDRAQQDAQREADKVFNERRKAAEKTKSEKDKETNRIFNEETKTCREQQKRREFCAVEIMCRDGRHFPKCNGQEPIKYPQDPCRTPQPLPPPPPPSQTPVPPNHCSPIICSDGRQFPTCDPNGFPINYFQNPCNTPRLRF